MAVSCQYILDRDLIVSQHAGSTSSSNEDFRIGLQDNIVLKGIRQLADQGYSASMG